MSKVKTLQVLYHGRLVGTLAQSDRYRVAFQYANEWLADGFSISPRSLPLENRVFVPRGYEPFEGLFGVFADSLPDGWGRLLVDRMLRKNGLDPAEVSSLDRLAIVGETGMGALTYQPEDVLQLQQSDLSLDELALECKKVFEDQYSDNLDELFLLGGSSGGARPKVYYHLDGKEWIVKFPSSIDAGNIGVQEYDYAQCAAKCGIIMPETKLLPSRLGPGYFATSRFDRKGEDRIHMISVSGILETSHRIPNLDYTILMKLVMSMTKDYDEAEKLYRLMCFNVFAHNRDDHSKNFSFLYEDGWHLSPGYDLTYSNSIGGEHATTVNGNGQNPGIEDLIAVANVIRFDAQKARQIALEIQEIVNTDLRQYLHKST